MTSRTHVRLMATALQPLPPPRGPVTLPSSEVWAWILAVVALAVLASCAGPGGDLGTPPPGVAARSCQWPHPRCCSTPPSIDVVSLRDIRAERWRAP